MFNPLGKLFNLQNPDAALEMLRGMGVDLDVQPVTKREEIIAAVEALARAALGSDVEIKRLVVKGDKPMQALIVMGGAIPITGK